MTVKSSSPAGVFRRLQNRYASPEAQDLVALGMYSPYIPEDVRVSLIQKGTARLTGPEKGEEIRREGLETAAQAAGLGLAVSALPSLVEPALRKGLESAKSKSLERVAENTYDALTLPGGVAHESTAMLGGDALSHRESEAILSRLRNKGVAYRPNSTVNHSAALQPKNQFYRHEKTLVPAATERLKGMLRGQLPSAEELGKARGEWAAQTDRISKSFPGWDRPGTLDKSDFGRIANSLRSIQGGDTRAASSILTSTFSDELAAAAATNTPAGSAARKALGQVSPETFRGVGSDRLMAGLEGGVSRLKETKKALEEAPTLLSRLAEKTTPTSRIIKYPGVSHMLSRRGVGALGVGTLAGVVGALMRKRELERLAEMSPTEEEIRRELRARDKSTALAMGQEYGSPGRLERATLRAQDAKKLRPRHVQEAVDTLMLLSGG